MNKPHHDPIAPVNDIPVYDVDEWELDHIEIQPMNHDENETDMTAFYSFGTIDPESF